MLGRLLANRTKNLAEPLLVIGMNVHGINLSCSTADHGENSHDPHRFSNGLNACAILFCAAPLGILGAVQDGLPTVAGATGYYQVLAVKAVMDGLAMLGFVALFGGGAIVAALPVFVFQGTITLAVQVYLEPFLRTHGLVDSVNAVGGLVVCTVGVVIFEIRRVDLADYLPALAVAPLITWLWK